MQLFLYLLVSAGVVALDQITKYLTVHFIPLY